MKWISASSLRSKPLSTARFMTPSASLQVILSLRATAAFEASLSQSMASASNKAVNCYPLSGQGTRIWRTPCSSHVPRGTRILMIVVNWQVSRCRQARSCPLGPRVVPRR